ncbi:MAG: hypothetical protein R3D29_06690 [Nitratireductor sp.]
MGNALTWPFPVHYKVVRNASPDRVVRKGADGMLSVQQPLRELAADGVDGITTNCGFLSLFPGRTCRFRQFRWQHHH